MTDEDEPLGPYADELAELDRVTQRVRRAEKTLADAKKDAKPQTVRAMRAGIAEGQLGVRSEVQRHSPFSAPTVRSIADEAGIPPDERYVRTPKTVAAAPVPISEPESWAEPSPSMRPISVPSEGELPADIRAIHPGVAAEIVDKIRRGFPTWHNETRGAIAAAPPLFQNLLEIKRAKDAGVLDDLGIDLP